MSLSLVDIDTDKGGGQISVSDLLNQLTEFLVFNLAGFVECNAIFFVHGARDKNTF